MAKTRRRLDFEDIEALRNLDFSLRERANSLENNIFQNMGFPGTSHQNALQKLVVKTGKYCFPFHLHALCTKAQTSIESIL